MHYPINKSLRWTWPATLVAACVAIGLLAGCGSNSSGSSKSSSTKAAVSSNAAGTKSSAAVMMIGAIHAAGIGDPTTQNAAQAAIDAVNASGGLGGHPLKLTTCDDNGDPNQAGVCAREAVNDHVIAVISGNEIFTQAIVPLLQKANIPFLGDLTAVPTDLTSPVAFPVTAPAVAVGAGGMNALVKYRGCKKIAIFLPLTPGGGSGFVQKSVYVDWARALGATVTSYQLIPPTQVNVNSNISQALSAGSQCILDTLLSSSSPGFVAALKQSAKPSTPVATITADFPGHVVSQLAGDINGYLVTSPLYAPSDPASGSFASEMSKYGSTKNLTLFAQNTWVATNLLTRTPALSAAAAKATTLTGPAVLNILNQASGLKVPGVVGSLSFTKSLSPKLPRLFVTSFVTYQLKDGKYVSMGPTTINPYEVGLVTKYEAP